MFSSLAAVNSALSQSLTCMFKLILSIYPLNLTIYFPWRLTFLCVATMLLCVAALPVAIVFQKHLLPDTKDEWGGGCRERGVRSHHFNSFFMGCKTCPSWHQLSLSLSFLSSFAVSMISMKKPWIKFPTWETHLSGDVNAWLTPLPVGLQTWHSLMVLECWHGWVAKAKHR